MVRIPLSMGNAKRNFKNRGINMETKYVKLIINDESEPRYFELVNGKVTKVFYERKWIFREDDINFVGGYDQIYSTFYQKAIFMERKAFDHEVSEQAKKYTK